MGCCFCIFLGVTNFVLLRSPKRGVGMVLLAIANVAVFAGYAALRNQWGQEENVALAKSLYFYNPQMKSTVVRGGVLSAAVAGAVWGAILFGICFAAAKTFPRKSKGAG